MSKFAIILCAMISLAYPDVFATKCLKAQTMEELKNDFPVVIRGKVSKRVKINESSFALKITVQKLLKGILKQKEVNAVEVHYGRGFWRTYEVGNEYTFPIDTEGKSGTYEVVVPGDGCPALPAN
ncbi:hypothetical protein [Bdellovibrio svalbardensis]|uniref:Uncharacterized protein n=1 Tax=Bdellovibrio svalbardensis TaxID=2972972 RepID=A0ABT6DHX3_9BACT|nr:hypothetical protein [Bdellovibrio svalbardensis]MDG0816457.1 hypothetical protein [Bdellovibrio svalbardensis]